MAQTNIIAQVTFQSPTGLSKDRFENVWHFLDPDGGDPIDVAGTGNAKLANWYLNPPGGENHEPAYYMAPMMVPFMTIKTYDFAAAKPRPILGEATYLYTPEADSVIPENVALCLSYYTNRNIVSHRGRIYLGPFTLEATTTGETSPCRPNAGLMGGMVANANTMLAAGPPGTVIEISGISTYPEGTEFVDTTAWALYSVKLGTFSAVGAGWVDDEWDGQRRRRVEASERTVFPT